MQTQIRHFQLPQIVMEKEVTILKIRITKTNESFSNDNDAVEIVLLNDRVSSNNTDNVSDIIPTDDENIVAETSGHFVKNDSGSKSDKPGHECEWINLPSKGTTDPGRKRGDDSTNNDQTTGAVLPKSVGCFDNENDYGSNMVGPGQAADDNKLSGSTNNDKIGEVPSNENNTCDVASKKDNTSDKNVESKEITSDSEDAGSPGNSDVNIYRRFGAKGSYLTLVRVADRIL